MQLVDALKILGNRRPDAERVDAFLCCGFTPLHLATLLSAELQTLFPDRRVDLRTGLYGDLLGNIARLGAKTGIMSAVVIEWPDFDPRLGIRQACAWSPTACQDILSGATEKARLLRDVLGSVTGPIALCLPTLPIPPAAHVSGARTGAFHARLRELAASLASWAADRQNIRVVNPERLDECSPASARFDPGGDLLTGFPWSIEHASAVAGLLAALLRAKLPKKGIITDLDDTVWRGLLGDVGPDGVSWDLENKSRIHGVYQQLLAALAQEGTLVAVASKNDSALVDKAFERPDILLRKDLAWPIEANWGPKSESVRRILAAWNIGADSVVFVDDSPMELAEVKMAHPGIETLQFPATDSRAAFNVLLRIRDLFGKDTVREEDGLRLASLRSAHQWEDEAPGTGTSDDFLANAGAEIELQFGRPSDSRALELINKTNQFNLNGRRYSETEWASYLSAPGVIVLVVSYKDRFGPLGRIMVLTGRLHGSSLEVDSWVLSCRAFSRRVEHRVLEQLFRKFDLTEIVFDFMETPRNGPTQEFLRSMTHCAPAPNLRLRREVFFAALPQLSSSVAEACYA